MIKVPGNGQEGGQGQVREKALLDVLCSRFAKRGIQDVFKLGLDCAPVNVFGKQGFGNLV